MRPIVRAVEAEPRRCRTPRTPSPRCRRGSDVTLLRLRVWPDAVVRVTVLSQNAVPVSLLHPFVVVVSARSSNGRVVHDGALHGEALPATSTARTEMHDGLTLGEIRGVCTERPRSVHVGRLDPAG